MNTPRVAVAAPLVVVAASHQLPPTLPHVSLCRSLAALLSRHAQVCARQADAHVPVGIYCGRRQGHGRPQGPLRHHQPLDLSHRPCTRVCFSVLWRVWRWRWRDQGSEVLVPVHGDVPTPCMINFLCHGHGASAACLQRVYSVFTSCLIRVYTVFEHVAVLFGFTKALQLCSDTSVAVFYCHYLSHIFHYSYYESVCF